MEFDIVHGESFIKSRCFAKACEELKQKGHGIIESYKEITPKG